MALTGRLDDLSEILGHNSRAEQAVKITARKKLKDFLIEEIRERKKVEQQEDNDEMVNDLLDQFKKEFQMMDLDTLNRNEPPSSHF